jgi:mono/diheme cytochrome c family protein
MKRIFPILTVALMVLVMVPLAVGKDKVQEMAEKVDMEAAKATFEETCGKCHGLDRPLGKKKDRDGWESTVERMSGYHKRFGGPIPKDDQDAIIEYLVKVAGK